METMQRERSQLRSPWWVPAILSFGGGYLRIWRPYIGITVEIPMAVVFDTRVDASTQGQRQGYQAIGTPAAELEEKISEHQQFLRPYYGDRIIDRQALQTVLRHAIELDISTLSGIGRLLAPFQYWVQLPPTVSGVHARWLRQTAWEVGIWPWRERGVFPSLAMKGGRPQELSLDSADRQPGHTTQMRKNRKNQLNENHAMKRFLTLQNRNDSRSSQGSTAVVGILDIGFSAVRVYCGVPNALFFAARFEEGLEQFCKRIVAYEEQQSQRRYPVSTLYDQRWQVKHPSLDLQTGKASLQRIPPQHFAAVLERYGEDISAFIRIHLESLPASQRALLQQSGWQVIGGGAQLPGLIAQLEASLNMPFSLSAQAQYAEFPDVE